MKVAYLIEPQKIELREVPTPVPSIGELLIKVETALTCGTDKKAYLRGHPLIPMPGPFGHEFSGTVVEVGDGVSAFKVGDAIMTVHSAPCYGCWYCNKGIYNQCVHLMDSKILGAFSEYILLPRHIVNTNLYLKPKGLSFESASLLEPLSCVIHGLSKLNLNDCNRVAVIGTGPIALLFTLVLSHRGIEVITIGRTVERLTGSIAYGASEWLLLSDERCKDLNVDLVVECTGAVDVWEKTPMLTRKGGTVLLFGGCPRDSSASFDTYRLHYDEITLKGAFHFTPADVKEAYDLLASGLKVEGLITATYPLDEITTVFERLSRGEGLKYAIKP